jgi:hypothetical protein
MGLLRPGETLGRAVIKKLGGLRRTWWVADRNRGEVWEPAKFALPFGKTVGDLYQKRMFRSLADATEQD